MRNDFLHGECIQKRFRGKLEGGIDSQLNLTRESLLPMSPTLKTWSTRPAGTALSFCFCARIDAVTFPHHRDDLLHFNRRLGTLCLASRLRSRQLGEPACCRI